jgi:hypothetical protein
MNVQPNDLAILMYPRHPENKGRICTIERQLPPAEGEEDGVWWMCIFTRPVKTDQGLIGYSTIPDWRLRRITGLGAQEALSIRTEEPASNAA